MRVADYDLSAAGEYGAAERVAQGLPPKVKDPVVLARIARILAAPMSRQDEAAA